MKPTEGLAKRRVDRDEVMLRKARGDYVIGLGKAIEALKQDINDYAKAFYPEFHFMDHIVSRFWRCEKSPVGVCIFERGGVMHNLPTDCVFCHQPAERK